MQLHWIDWAFVAGYCIFALGVGVFFSRRAGSGTEDFFLGGRKFRWWLAGTSIVATSFAVDTPLAVSGFIRSGGIYVNWLWWGALMGGMLCVFFYARLWRRAGVVTDVEFIELRYEGPSAAALRGFMAVYGGILQNCIVMGWVILAMAKICDVMLGWPKLTSIAVLLAITLVYTILSGFWGVVMTDFVQFFMAMTGSISLAGIVLWKMGGPVGMVTQIQASDAFDPKVFYFVPDFATATRLALITFMVQISIQWWGGGQGGGYLAQRLFATPSERDSALAALWFNFAHYVLRPWPWIIVGLASLAYFPVLPNEDPELAYPRMIVRFLPIGLRGLMVASLLAAFMSTMDTQLNWGASYLVNDLYRRFLVRDESPRHYVMAARVSIVLLMGCAAFAAWQSDSIAGAWIYLAKLTAGAGLVGLLRWYWWRVNAWSEITALTGSLVVANGNLAAKALSWAGLIPPGLMERVEWLYAGEQYAILLPIIIAVCTILWLTVTFLTRPVSDEHIEIFFRRVRPGGWWGRMAARCPGVARDRIRGAWLGWLAGVVCVYAGLFGVGYLCLGKTWPGVAYLCLSAVTGWYMVSRASLGEQTPS